MSLPILKTYEVIDEVVGERIRQDSLWGQQNHVNDRWNTILVEEVGEAAKETYEGDTVKLREELIQVAAVAVAWIEAIDRAKDSPQN